MSKTWKIDPRPEKWLKSDKNMKSGLKTCQIYAHYLSQNWQKLTKKVQKSSKMLWYCGILSVTFLENLRKLSKIWQKVDQKSDKNMKNAQESRKSEVKIC